MNSKCCDSKDSSRVLSVLRLIGMEAMSTILSPFFLGSWLCHGKIGVTAEANHLVDSSFLLKGLLQWNPCKSQ